MIYGLPDLTFYVALGVPVGIAVLLLIWGKLYNPEEDE